MNPSGRMMIRILMSLVFGLTFLIPYASALAQPPKSSEGAVKEIVLTPEQMKKYASSYKDPHALHIRKVMNRYLMGKPEGDDNYEALKVVDKEYLKNKFVILSIENSLMGGKEILLISQKKTDKIFKAWVYKTGGKYELRAFDVAEFPDEEIRKIQIIFRRFLQDKELSL